MVKLPPSSATPVKAEISVEPHANVQSAVTITEVTAEVAVSPNSLFTNGLRDALELTDERLSQALKQLHGDAATMERVLPALDEKVVVVGTARSKPVPGANGFEDFAWGEVLGEELRKAELAVGTGAGPGAMEAPLRGHARMDALLDLQAKKHLHATKGLKANSKTGWEVIEAKDPQRQGAQIILPHEQASNPFIPESNQGKFDRFLFRMEFLFRNTRDFVATPGGYGTLAEIFTFMAQKSHGQNTDPIVFGAHDDFFKTLNTAFGPLLNEREKPDLANVFDDPKALVQHLLSVKRSGPKDDIPKLLGTMADQLEAGFTKLDGKPPAVAFFGGAGERSQATAEASKVIAAGLTESGVAVRVGGSPYTDQAVLEGVRSVDREAEVQAFAMADAPVQSGAGLDYTKVDDVLVLRELMNSNLRGIVATPEGAKQLGLLFTALCDVQTGEMPKIPIIVLDPKGEFEGIKAALKQTMLSSSRQYINAEDLDLFTVTTDPQQALALLNAPAPAATTPH